MLIGAKSKPKNGEKQCLQISVRKDFNERAHVQTSANRFELAPINMQDHLPSAPTMQTDIRREMLDEAGVSECQTAAWRMREESPRRSTSNAQMESNLGLNLGARARTEGTDGRRREGRGRACCSVLRN